MIKNQVLHSQGAKLDTMSEPANCCAIKPTAVDQVCLITGCASGIGRDTALAFAVLNYRLVLVDKQTDRLAETAELCRQKSSKEYKVSCCSTVMLYVLAR